VTANRKRLKLEIIESNLSEAIEELETIRNRASSGELNEADLQVGLCHATPSEFGMEYKARTHVEVRTARSTMEACQGSPSRCRFPNPPIPNSVSGTR
jgi:hypothetical protein